MRHSLYDQPEATRLPGRNQRTGDQDVLWRCQCPRSRENPGDEQIKCDQLDKKRDAEERALVSSKNQTKQQIYGTVELDELYWFLEFKPQTETRENVYIMTMVSREPRQIIGHAVSRDKTSQTIQCMVDTAPDAGRYCTDGYSGYLDVVYPGKHIFNIHSKKDTFTVEGVNADLRHYIPTLARRSRCFPRKLENLQAVVAVFVRAYNRFGLAKSRFRALHPGSHIPFSLFDFI